MELRDLARHLTRAAVRRGRRDTAAYVERFLSLSDAKQVSGYQVAVFRGLTLAGEAELGEGLEILSYERAAQRGLVRNDPPGPANDMPDYVGMGALVLARQMTWGPCLGPPRTSKDLGIQRPTPMFRCVPECSSGVIFDLLSLTTSHRVQLLSVLDCAPDFVDLNPNFGRTSSSGFLHDDVWKKQDLTQEHIDYLHGLLRSWAGFKVEDGSTLELGLNRLVSSIHRNRGRFPLQDRILDTAIALEVMYELPASELYYRLQTRAGHLLADTTEARITIAEEVKQFYGLRARSRTVGNGWMPKESADSGFASPKRRSESCCDEGASRIGRGWSCRRPTHPPRRASAALRPRFSPALDARETKGRSPSRTEVISTVIPALHQVWLYPCDTTI